VPPSESQPGRDSVGAEVLTPAETAAYLRVPDEAVLELIDKGTLPAQRIGGEWRLLKRAVVEWLRYGSHPPRDFRMLPPPWVLEHPFWEELVWALEQRILSKLPAAEPRPAKPGSKQAVLRHFGVFKDDADVDEQLAGIRARREAAGE
jgi:excisionase family DNA binding protein